MIRKDAVSARPKLVLLGVNLGNLQALSSGRFRHGSLASYSIVSDLVTCSYLRISGHRGDPLARRPAPCSLAILALALHGRDARATLAACREATRRPDPCPVGPFLSLTI